MINVAQFATEAENARKSVDRIREAVTTKRGELASARAERDRLQAAIISGDTAAMTAIIKARALVDGLEVHLKDLDAALRVAEDNVQSAQAQHLEARFETLDVEGVLTNDQLRAMWQEVQTKVDEIVHPALKKTEAHNAAIGELRELKHQAMKLRGESIMPSYSVALYPSILTETHGSIDGASDAALHEEHVAKSHDRYHAPAREAAHRAYLERIARESAEQRQWQESVVYP